MIDPRPIQTTVGLVQTTVICILLFLQIVTHLFSKHQSWLFLAMINILITLK
ncbi:hypothetical protein Hdeb2414_s0001g00026551 [Helianthus debilis subsp. tardiflorus]